MSSAEWEVAGNKLRSLRKNTGLSIFKVARQVGISGNYLSLLERGKQQPSDEVLYSLAEFYKLEPNELFKLYGRVTDKEISFLVSNPQLSKVINRLSTDKRLSREEFVQVSKIIQDIFELDKE